jgi:hypothetical protein
VIVDNTAEVLHIAAEAARGYLAGLEAAEVASPDAHEAAGRIGGPLPEDGDGALAAVHELALHGAAAGTWRRRPSRRRRGRTGRGRAGRRRAA